MKGRWVMLYPPLASFALVGFFYQFILRDALAAATILCFVAAAVTSLVWITHRGVIATGFLVCASVVLAAILGGISADGLALAIAVPFLAPWLIDVSGRKLKSQPLAPTTPSEKR